MRRGTGQCRLNGWTPTRARRRSQRSVADSWRGTSEVPDKGREDLFAAAYSAGVEETADVAGGGPVQWPDEQDASDRRQEGALEL